MVEAVVNFVVGKLAEFATEEVKFLYGVAGKAESLTSELQWIQAFLKDADSKSDKDERVKQWVKDVKEVAYMIEDAFDMYVLRMDEISKHTFRRIPKKIIAKHKLGTEIDKIRARISEIKDFRTKYGILELKVSTDNSRVSIQQQPMGQLVNPEIDEDIVGLMDATKYIIEKLTDESISRRIVLSIVGQPGLGKTTLAGKVYRSLKKQGHFNSYIWWLSISAEIDLTKILKNILAKVNCVDPISLGEKEAGDLIREIYESLKEKKYLIVLDDMWENQSFDHLKNVIQNALPDSNNGSRVLTTTRFINVAKKLDASIHPYELALLNEQESQELLLKKACCHCECPDDLLPLAKQLSKKCSGLPLALEVFGGQLSMTSLDYHSWDQVMQMMEWNHEGNKCMDAISTSYQNMPPHLKLCFMYLAVYPEDHRFEAKEVTRLWIAEGFITESQNANITMEDTADEYLKELAQRCMVQVLIKFSLGNIKKCQLHDLIREFAIRKAEEENILTVLSSTKNLYSSNNLKRRVALQFSNAKQIENISSNIRSLVTFGTLVKNLGRFKLLRVLNLNDYSEVSDDPQCSTNLRYLNTGNHHILSAVTYCKNLQTFIVRSVAFRLPKTFWDLKMLRHVILPGILRNHGPPSAAELNNLLTLYDVKAREEWSSKLPHFPRLRELWIELPGEFEWEPFTQLLGDLGKLEVLVVLNKYGEWFSRASNYSGVHFQLTPFFANFKSMKWLSMAGKWHKGAAIDFTMLPPNLVKLTLSKAELDEDPLPQLEKLPHLKVLKLIYNSYCGRRMACYKGGFPHLQRLVLVDCDSLEEWNIENGAMPIINRLELTSCEKLQMVPNFQHLTSLRQLTVQNMTPQFKLKLEGEDKYKVNHISSISISEGISFF